MFIDDSTTINKKGKKYRRVLIRNSYRINGKVHHDTLGNLSSCDDLEIESIKAALKYKDILLDLLPKSKDEIKHEQGLSFGADWLLYQSAKTLGIQKCLGNSEEAKRVLWMVISTLIGSTSRLSATRLAMNHAGCDIIGMESFCEEDLYRALDWLSENQRKIEKKLFTFHFKDKKPKLFLYDVTSSYFEGIKNELSNYGYNRDGKKGKKQIVIGMLTDSNGWPIACEVFKGNTSDPKTVINQIKKISNNFNCEEVVFVGDRGMIKSLQIENLEESNFFYITALTKAQIQKKINENIFDYELFDEKITEIEHKNIRYVLKRNPFRAKEIEENRIDKLNKLKKIIKKENKYLKEHSKANPDKAYNRIIKEVEKLKFKQWVKININNRELSVEQSNQDLKEKLDGCYVIKTNLSKKEVDKESIHNNYKNLKEVEWAFRTMKTTLLELRGIFVRKANRTKSHVFVMMLAYMIAYYLRRKWIDIEMTLEEAINSLTQICAINKIVKNVEIQIIPKPNNDLLKLFQKVNIQLPDAIPSRNIKVYTRKN